MIKHIINFNISDNSGFNLCYHTVNNFINMIYCPERTKYLLRYVNTRNKSNISTSLFKDLRNLSYKYNNVKVIIFDEVTEGDKEVEYETIDSFVEETKLFRIYDSKNHNIQFLSSSEYVPEIGFKFIKLSDKNKKDIEQTGKCFEDRRIFLDSNNVIPNKNINYIEGDKEIYDLVSGIIKKFSGYKDPWKGRCGLVINFTNDETIGPYGMCEMDYLEPENPFTIRISMPLVKNIKEVLTGSEDSEVYNEVYASMAESWSDDFVLEFSFMALLFHEIGHLIHIHGWYNNHFTRFNIRENALKKIDSLIKFNHEFQKESEDFANYYMELKMKQYSYLFMKYKLSPKFNNFIKYLYIIDGEETSIDDGN